MQNSCVVLHTASMCWLSVHMPCTDLHVHSHAIIYLINIYAIILIWVYCKCALLISEFPPPPAHATAALKGKDTTGDNSPVGGPERN